jgi:tetratricopeptide (TPR) repeat protein
MPAPHVSADDAYLFRHVLTRDAAYQLMPPSSRARLHVLAADAIEAPSAGLPETAVAEAADHLRAALTLASGLQGDNDALARREAATCARAAAALAAVYRRDEAIRLWRRVAASRATPVIDQGRALVESAQLCDAIGRHQEGIRDGHDARDRVAAITGADGMRIAAAGLRVAGVCAGRSGQLDLAVADLNASVVISRAVADASELSRTLTALASILFNAGLAAEAATTVRDACATAAESGDVFARGRAEIGRAVVLRAAGDIDEAEAALNIADSMITPENDRAAYANALGSRANLYLHTGRVAQAADIYRTACVEAAGAGDRRGEGIWIGNAGSALKVLGRIDEARAAYVRAQEIAREIGDVENEARTEMNIGNVLIDRGDIAGAEVAYRRAKVLADTLGSPRVSASALGNLATLLTRIGRPADALPLCHETVAICRRIRDPREEGIALRTLGDALMQLGHRTEGIAALEEAAALLRATRDATKEIGAVRMLADALRNGTEAERARAAEFDTRAAELDPDHVVAPDV